MTFIGEVGAPGGQAVDPSEHVENLLSESIQGFKE